MNTLLKYLAFVYNFRRWRWGKAGSLWGGLLVTGGLVAFAVWLPGWWRVGPAAILLAIHVAHWENFNGRQA